ncbi:MAG: hypothetical protein ACC683_05645, partial [Acidimicrobiia bacterium]
ERIEMLESELASFEDLKAENERLSVDIRTLEDNRSDPVESVTEIAEPSTAVPDHEPAGTRAAGEFDTRNDDYARDRIDNGSSLRDRIDAVQETPTPEGDSIDAIRQEAARALEEARSLRVTTPGESVVETETAEPEPFAPPPVIDYAPSVQAPARGDDDDEDEDDDDDEDEAPVESRYSRNSAKLPRLGIEPGSASSTIADLRRQMTADN